MPRFALPATTFACLVALSLAACGPTRRGSDDEPPFEEDAGQLGGDDAGDAPFDAGEQVPDAGAVQRDGGLTDAGSPDVSVPDAGTVDGGEVPDAGPRTCASGDLCSASYANGGCCEAYPNCRGTTQSATLRCRASCGPAAVACTSTSDCCSGLSCLGGVCAAAGPDGGTPDAGGTTAASCIGTSCTAWTECCNGVEFCRGATAGAATTCQAAPGPEGVRCREKGDCESGLACVSGVCSQPPCHRAGEGCASADECCSSAPYCTGSLSSPATKCSATRGAEGAPCQGPSDCQSPLGCSGGFCAIVDFRCRMLHQGCSSSWDCCGDELWCRGGSCWPLACGGYDDLCPGGGENDGCCSGLVCFGGLCRPPTDECTPVGDGCLLETCCSGLFCNARTGLCDVPQTNCGALYSSCTSSASCCTSIGLACNGGTCDYGTACRITGQACSATLPCCGGLACSGGTCVASTSCRSSGQGCSASSPCCAGLTCSGGTCRAPTTCRGSGQTCSASSGCCSGLSCTGGVCQAQASCVASGGGCAAAAQCCADAPFCRSAFSGGGSTTCKTSCGMASMSCTSSSDCCAGLQCTQGLCRSGCQGLNCGDGYGGCCATSPVCVDIDADGVGSCDVR